MKLFIVYTIAAFTIGVLANGYDNDHLYEARDAVLEARNAYFDAIEDYNLLEARRPFSEKCVCLLPPLPPALHTA